MIFLLPLLGCEPSTTTYKGLSIYNYMPLDVERSWSYTNETGEESEGESEGESEEESSSWDIDVVKVAEERLVNTKIVTLEYQEDSGSGEEGTPLFRIQWSSDSIDGILIHGYENIGSDPVVFDPPVVVAEPQMFSEDVVDTSTGGYNFTSTFHGVEACANRWISQNDEPWECAHLSISYDGADELPFIGDWWTANTWGTSIFTLSEGPLASENPWTLTQTDWASE